MRFLHTSDLHLGIKFHDIDLIEDQELILNQIVDIAKEQEVDAILLAGDIYDTTNPSTQAVLLLDKFLTTLVNNKFIVFMISGNHDQADKLSFGKDILNKSRVFISQNYETLNKDNNKIVIQDKYGKINIYLLPYIRPLFVRNKYNIEEQISYDEAVKIAIEKMNVDYNERNIILSHQFIEGAKACDSDNLKSIGGLDQVSYEYYKDFDYVALGHLHMPNMFGEKEHIRYSGSPLKYSFSERLNQKQVVIVDIKEKGNIEINTYPLKPLREVAMLEGEFETLINDEQLIDSYKNVFLQIDLTDTKEIPFAKEELKNRYKNLVKITYKNLKEVDTAAEEKTTKINIDDPIDIIKKFYEEQTGDILTEKQQNIVEEILGEI